VGQLLDAGIEEPLRALLNETKAADVRGIASKFEHV
jgi:hypothetical protein